DDEHLVGEVWFLQHVSHRVERAARRRRQIGRIVLELDRVERRRLGSAAGRRLRISRGRGRGGAFAAGGGRRARSLPAFGADGQSLSLALDTLSARRRLRL